MTESVEAIVAKMRAVCPQEERDGEVIRTWADRLQSAHDAEVGALRDAEAETFQRYVDANESRIVTESQLLEAEWDARRLRETGGALIEWMRAEYGGETTLEYEPADTPLGTFVAALAESRAMEGEDG